MQYHNTNVNFAGQQCYGRMNACTLTQISKTYLSSTKSKDPYQSHWDVCCFIARLIARGLDARQNPNLTSLWRCQHKAASASSGPENFCRSPTLSCNSRYGQFEVGCIICRYICYANSV